MSFLSGIKDVASASEGNTFLIFCELKNVTTLDTLVIC
jgi:hypothetical protein